MYIWRLLFSNLLIRFPCCPSARAQQRQANAVRCARRLCRVRARVHAVRRGDRARLHARARSRGPLLRRVLGVSQRVSPGPMERRRVDGAGVG
jgi:hypothetical protein